MHKVYEVCCVTAGHWGCVCVFFYMKGSEYSGFLWDSSAGIQLKEAVVLESAAANGNGNDAQPKAYLGHFYVSSRRFVQKGKRRGSECGV